MVQTFESASPFQGKSNFLASPKVFVVGSRLQIHVRFQQVTPDHTTGRFGHEANTPMKLYDTSGPYIDSPVSINLTQGLTSARREQVLKRGGIQKHEEYSIKVIGESIARPLPRLKGGELLYHV